MSLAAFAVAFNSLWATAGTANVIVHMLWLVRKFLFQKFTHMIFVFMFLSCIIPISFWNKWVQIFLRINMDQHSWFPYKLPVYMYVHESVTAAGFATQQLCSRAPSVRKLISSTAKPRINTTNDCTHYAATRSRPQNQIQWRCVLYRSYLDDGAPALKRERERASARNRDVSATTWVRFQRGRRWKLKY